MGKFVDLTGKKFNRLTVLRRAENHRQPNGKTTIMWECLCDCGSVVIVRGDCLRNRTSKSCGCLQKDIVKDLVKGNMINKKYNTYDLSGDFGIGYTSKGEEFYFDLDDYDKIKDYCWRIDPKGYVVASTFGNNNEKKTTIRFHRLILPNTLFIDHIHGEPSRNDNRKSNLRPCTSSQNSMNVKTRSDNTSGATGVYWYKQMGKWLVKICIDGNSIHVGYFDTFEEAVVARKNAELKYFGEFSYDYSQQLGV